MKYQLPSGAAEINAARMDGFQSEVDYRYPNKRADLEGALREALQELWKVQHERLTAGNGEDYEEELHA